MQTRLFDIGEMKVNAKLVTKRIVQKSTDFTIVQVGIKSGAKSQRLSESGSKKRERRGRNGSGKEVLVRIVLIKVNGTGAISA